jgi:hypothetical protein
VKVTGKIKRGLAFLLGHDGLDYPWPVRCRVAGREVCKLLFRTNKPYCPSKEITDTVLLKQLQGFKTLNDYCAYLRRREKPSFFSLTSQNGLKQLAEEYRQLYSQSSPRVIAAADKVLGHVFDLLGSGPVKLVGKNRQNGYESIAWHTDFKSGFTWDKDTYYKDIQYGHQAGVDVKVPWELSRCQHFPTLGQAYLLTADEKYAREFTNEVLDWVTENPAGCGVNWVCSMDVAIRAVNWCWGFYFFKDSAAVTDEFNVKFVKSLYQHGLHIMGNLEKDLLGRNSNHYLSDLAGLAYLGTLLPELKLSHHWRKYAFKEIIREAKKQLYPDGADYEGSISYHRLVVEIFLSVTLLGKANGVSFPNWYWERLEKALEFIAQYTRPDGKAPLIGDNDDGRLHILADYDNSDRTGHRYLLAAGAVLFEHADYKRASGGFSEEAFWLTGEDGRQKYQALSVPAAVSFPPSGRNDGFYILRRDNLYLIMDCLHPDIKAPSGHRHNSRLSFELFAGDKAFITDPGTYLYTPDPAARNLFRGTAYHNTLVVDSEEQNNIDAGSLFQIGQDAHVKVNRWQIGADFDVIDAEHTGYHRLDNPVLHRRQIFSNKKDGYWIIRDLLTGVGSHRCDLYFHFTPLDITIDKLTVKTSTSGTNLAVVPLVTEGLEVMVEKGWVSRGYGTKVEAPVVKYSRYGQMPFEFCNILYPFEKELDIKVVVSKAKEIDFTRYFGGEA